MSTQVKRRRGTQAENDAFTGALGEIVVDTTNNRAVVHDASTAGGFPIPNAKDVQNNAFTAAAGTLSAGVYSATIPKVTAYAPYQRFTINPDANNVADVNININSIGSTDINKDDGDGVLVELEADDIKANIPFDIIRNAANTKFIAQLGGSTVQAGLELIASSTPTGVATVTFSSIPQTYRGLFLEFSEISCNTATRYLRVDFRNPTPSILSTIGYKVVGTTVSSLTGSALGTATTMSSTDHISGSFYVPVYTNLTGIIEVNINSYNRLYTATYNRQSAEIAYVNGSFYTTGATDNSVDSIQFLWNSTGNFDAGTINLYGIL